MLHKQKAPAQKERKPKRGARCTKLFFCLSNVMMRRLRGYARGYALNFIGKERKFFGVVLFGRLFGKGFVCV
jgi:hypothetical protein